VDSNTPTADSNTPTATAFMHARVPSAAVAPAALG